MSFNCCLAPNLRKHGLSSAKADLEVTADSFYRWVLYFTLLSQDDQVDWTLASSLFTLKKERGLTWQACSIKEKDNFVLKELFRKLLMGKMDPLAHLGSQLDWQDLLCGFSRSAMFKLETNARNLKLSIGFVYTMLSERVWWAKCQSSFLNN